METLVAVETDVKHFNRPGYEAHGTNACQIADFDKTKWFEVRESNIIGEKHNSTDLSLFN